MGGNPAVQLHPHQVHPCLPYADVHALDGLPISHFFSKDSPSAQVENLDERLFEIIRKLNFVLSGSWIGENSDLNIFIFKFYKADVRIVEQAVKIHLAEAVVV